MVNLQENQRLAAHQRTQPLQSPPHREPSDFQRWEHSLYTSEGTSLGAMQSSNWTARISYCEHFPFLVSCCCILSCLHGPTNRALGCLSIAFLSTPAASKSAHTCIHVTRMGPLPAPPHLGVFTLQFPSARSHPTTSSKLATAEVAVKEPKEVDGALFKMPSRMPPVKHVSSSGGPSTCQEGVEAEGAEVQPDSSTAWFPHHLPPAWSPGPRCVFSWASFLDICRLRGLLGAPRGWLWQTLIQL